MTLQTEFEFTLPKGYVDKDGKVHRKGLIRLATAKDEIVWIVGRAIDAHAAVTDATRDVLEIEVFDEAE